MFKLQISCIIIVCFLFLLFLMEKDFKKETRKLFFWIMIVSIFQIIFEMLVINTIDQVKTISPVLFISIHRAYLACILTIFYLNFYYMQSFFKEEINVPKKGQAFMNMAQIILYASIFLLPIGYTQNEQVGEFDYGPGVWAVYVGVCFYLLIIFSNYCGYSRKIAGHKIMPLMLGFGTGMCISFYYMCLPQSNITCAAVAIMNIAIYISGHQPSVQNECRESEHAENEQSEYQISFEAPDARVLVVDDSEMQRRIFINLLAATKMQADQASDGRECLELVKKNHYDVIFMDHLMPEMDGIETFQKMRKEHLCDHTPVAILTANTTGMTPDEYIALGFKAFISKPVIPEKLEKTIYELLNENVIASVHKEKIIDTETKITEETIEKTSEDTFEETSEKSGMSVEWKDLPMLDGLDYNYSALHFVDTDSLIETILFLVDVMRSDMKELQTYYDSLDNEASRNNFETKVHSMKNSAMTVGIVPLAGLAKTLEDSAKENNQEQIYALMPIFMQKWEAYRNVLMDKFGQETEEKQPGDPTTEEIKSLFERLRAAAGDMDIDMLDSVMSEIDGYAFESRYEDKLQNIRKAVINFDIEYIQEEGFL